MSNDDIEKRLTILEEYVFNNKSNDECQYNKLEENYCGYKKLCGHCSGLGYIIDNGGL